MDMTILERELPLSDEPGLQTLDPRMGEIADLVQAGDFVGASAAVGALFEEGICDIRLVGYFGFGPFSDQGPAAFESVFAAFLGALDTNWDAFGPVKKREKLADQSLTWFGKQVVKRLQREEGTKDATWSAWTDSMTPDEVDSTLSALRRLQGSVDERLGEAGTGTQESLSNIRLWLDGFRNSVRHPESESDLEDESDDSDEESAGEAADTHRGAGGGGGTELQVQGSPYLVEFLRQLEAFEQLIERGEFKRALIVADAVNTTLEEFDPRRYFPQFFRTYARLQATHADALVEYEEYRETPEWNALRMLLQVDVDGFVEL